jgi:predicted RNA-binding Zn-ribbon protein involved in translation (DUF1610 family)
MTTPYPQMGASAPKDKTLSVCNDCGREFSDYSEAHPCPFCGSIDITRPEIK